MKPRFAPCNEYFPELTCLKSKRPSSEVITHCAFCRFLASTMVTRARASGFSPIAFTMVPAMRNVASDDWLGSTVELWVARPAREEDNTIPNASITLRNDDLRIGMGLLAIHNQRQLQVFFLARDQTDQQSFRIIGTHRFGIAVFQFFAMIESKHTIGTRR